MKKILLSFCFYLYAISASAQFQNPGFEQKTNTNSDLPALWNVAPVAGYTAALAGDVKHDGGYSLKMDGKPQDPSKFLNVSQNIPIVTNQIKRIKITAYIKTENLKGNVAMWCQVWDENKKRIGFENSGMQGVTITGTSDWQKYSMNLIVPKEAKSLFFGAYTKGTGTVWFDDFAIEEFDGVNDQPAAEVLKFNKEFTDIVKQNSIYTDSINWKSVDEDLKSLGIGLKTIADARILNNFVLQQLRKAGDNHSFIQDKVSAKNYSSGNTVQAKPEAKLLPDGLGYIIVPGFGSTNIKAMKAFATNIQTLIKNLDTANKIKGWVVDLRTNTGGNMYPMISGLGPLLDHSKVGYFMRGRTGNPWVHRKTGMGMTINNPYQVKNRRNKIAILIGPMTSSSGEMTAITFIGQKNTKLFGEPSGGYVTANQMFGLSDGSNLLLASSYVADRNKKKYLDRIYPDVLVKPVAGQDAALQAAEAWLKSKN